MDTIYCANVFLKGKKTEAVAKDVMIVGNSPVLIWGVPYLKNYLITTAYKTPAKIRTASEDPTIKISKIEFLSSHGKSQYHWGTTDNSIEVTIKNTKR